MRELARGDRVIENADNFAVLVPYAAQSPLEQWIVPHRHSPWFGESYKAERAELGGVLQRALHRMRSVVGDAAYNVVVEPGSQRAEYRHAAHWSVRITPDLLTTGGFELGSGVAVNPSSPEDDALLLREANRAAHEGTAGAR